MINIYICSRTAYIEEGVTIVDKNKIFQRYRKSWLITDLLSAIPLDLIGFFITKNEEIIIDLAVIRMFRLLRLLNVFFHVQTSNKITFCLLIITSRCINLILLINNIIFILI